MKRIVVAAALILLIAGSLARDESWTTAGYAAMLRQMEQLEQDILTCDCAAPSPECVELCNVEPGPGICGTYAAEMDRLLREALIRGARPDVIAELIRQHPFAPFEREIILVNWSRSQAR